MLPFSGTKIPTGLSMQKEKKKKIPTNQAHLNGTIVQWTKNPNRALHPKRIKGKKKSMLTG
jgi:hypothetical protein